MKLGKFSIGMGDRFAQEAEAQLQACLSAAEAGVEITPVWNKSNREHVIVGSEPASVTAAAQAAVKALHWRKPWHIDADHIRLETVDRFLPHSDFFTIDVADSIGKPAEDEDIQFFLKRHAGLIGQVSIPGIDGGLQTTREQVEKIARNFLAAVKEVNGIYRHIVSKKGQGKFITEVSMDETEHPATPLDLLIILAALADEKVPLQTIAPKFTGRFNKGVDYVGNLAQFEKEFNDDLCVIKYAITKYGLPANLKLSVHSGSDKFSIYGAIHRAVKRHNAGLHLKTAGTTWLEEIIGLAEAGGEGLVLAKEIYAEALDHFDELCGPYATVIDIDKSKLPPAATVNQWTSVQFTGALRHEQKNKDYNLHIRQLLHVAYKLAAKKGARYLDLIGKNKAVIARNVTTNLFDRHIKPVFIGLT